MPHFMLVSLLHINLLNLSWIIKCLFLSNMEPLMAKEEYDDNFGVGIIFSSSS